MALTESHPARPGGSDSPTAETPVTHRRGPWRRPVLLGLGALLMAAVVVLAVLAGTYQPVQSGDESGGTWPGLPAGGLRAVNTFGAQTGQVYALPQSGVFTVTESIFNNGPEAVTIEAVSILSPQAQANIPRGTRAWPLVPAGPVRWRLAIIGSAVKKPWSGNSVAGFSLSPRQALVLGIPLRMSAACYTQGSWIGIDTFYVKERFLSFTHWVTVQFQPTLIMHQPESSIGEPAKDLLCPAGTSR